MSFSLHPGFALISSNFVILYALHDGYIIMNRITLVLKGLIREIFYLMFNLILFQISLPPLVHMNEILERCTVCKPDLNCTTAEIFFLLFSEAHRKIRSSKVPGKRAYLHQHIRTKYKLKLN